MHKLTSKNSLFWCNPLQSDAPVKTIYYENLSIDTIKDAEALMKRFSPYLISQFHEAEITSGAIESPLTEIPVFQQSLITFVGGRIPGKWYVKSDHMLPISGSIKARGGMYTLLKYAETIALNTGLLNLDDDYMCFGTAPFKSLFQTHTIVVSSTGNLGLSIGLIGRRLGFNVEVHMSKDAKPWKVTMLKEIGTHVVQHDGSYTDAVKAGREQSKSMPNAYFIDDEQSTDLFTGYAIAGLELEKQLKSLSIEVDETHPLFVYLPCGVGGAPSGIAYALKTIFGSAVHLWTAEPIEAPCMILGLMTGKHQHISIESIGLTGHTLADGLAVGTSSALASDILSSVLSGAYTLSDALMNRMQYLLYASENISLEISALAGFAGPFKLFYTPEGFGYLKDRGLLPHVENITHISWATGGSMVPYSVMHDEIKCGQALELNTFE